MSARLPVALLLAAALAGASWATTPAEPVALQEAELGLEFHRHNLEDLGVELRFRRPVGQAGEAIRAVFETTSSPSLGLRLLGGSFEGLAGGALRFDSGFDLVWAGGRQSLAEFELAPGREPALFELRAADGTVPFLLTSPHPLHRPGTEEFVFLNMDLLVSETLATRLGVPELGGITVGTADVRTRLAGPLPRGVVCTPDYAGDVDVRLTRITNLFEAHHDTERVAMAPAVELENVGQADVEWYRPIEPDGGGGAAGPHPFLTMSLYRLADGVLRQIGRGDVKHAFFATNDGCDCEGAQILFDGCLDEYGAGTNSNRINLAPRREVNASTGSWQSLGSHFDGAPLDDVRSHYGTDHTDPFEHRLTAQAAELLIPGAEYFIEAWYVVAGDVDIFNSMGHRSVAPALGAAWVFPFTDAGVTEGPALDRWVDRAAPGPGQSATVLATGEGHVELVADAKALPGGVHRYDYGLMNFDFDRQIRSFAVPLPPGVELASVSFYDGDDDPGNDWPATVGASEIVWSTPDGAPALGALDWGVLFNFGFDANAAPTDPLATMGVLEAGSPAQLTAATRGPGTTLVPVNRLDVTVVGSGTGAVTSAPAGIGCGPDCDELYAPGTAVQLAAAADPGSALVRWREGGAALGTADTQDTLLDVDRALEAVFELCDRQLPAQTVDGAETFEACQVLTAGAGFEVGATGEVTLRAGERVVLGEGFAMQPGGELAIELDPALLP